MEERLNEIMEEYNEVIRQIEDMLNVFRMITESPYEYEGNVCLNSLLNVHIRLIEDVEVSSKKVHQMIDETILDIIHDRI